MRVVLDAAAELLNSQGILGVGLVIILSVNLNANIKVGTSKELSPRFTLTVHIRQTGRGSSAYINCSMQLATECVTIRLETLPVWWEDASKSRAGTQALELTSRIKCSDSRDGCGDGEQCKGDNLDHVGGWQGRGRKEWKGKEGTTKRDVEGMERVGGLRNQKRWKVGRRLAFITLYS